MASLLAVAPFVIAVAQTPIKRQSAGKWLDESVDDASHCRSEARLIQFPESALSGYAREQIQSREDQSPQRFPLTASIYGSDPLSRMEPREARSNSVRLRAAPRVRSVDGM